MPMITASSKAKQNIKYASNWGNALKHTEDRLMEVERQRNRLRMAIRLMKRQVKDGVPWPGDAAKGLIGQDEC